MKITVYDSKSSRYGIMEITVALKKEHIHTFHPLSVNQIDIDAAVVDAIEMRNGYLLADALTEQLTRGNHWNDVNLRSFLRHLSIRINGDL